MILMPISTWSEFKSLVIEAKGLSYQFAESSDRYEIYASENLFVWNISLLKGTSDATDFETNYKTSGNSQAKERVIQVLGKDNLSLSPRASIFTVPKGTTYNYDKQLDATLVVRGGILFTQDGIVGDSLKVQVIDKDDVLGLGATPGSPIVLGQYVKEWFVMPGIRNELVDISISQTLMAGLYFRYIYTSTSLLVNPTVILNLLAYEIIA